MMVPGGVRGDPPARRPVGPLRAHSPDCPPDRGNSDERRRGTPLRAVVPPVKNTIRSTAPARIDLAGGTLDIYPLYLFEEFGITVNAAINYGSEVTVSLRDDTRVVLRSLDIYTEQWADRLEDLDIHGPLPLLARIARWYLKDFDQGVTITTRNKAPKGSGLGASSCLLIALSGALNELAGRQMSGMDLVQVGVQLEAQTIGIPCGKQDYMAAVFGGVNALWFEPGEDRVERLGEEAIAELNQRVVLSYTGLSRFSGTSNWVMTKTYIDNDYGAREKIRAIKQTALSVRDALLSGDWAAFADCVAEEWENRRGLAAGVTTSKIDKIIASAQDAGALASKICGAGGGGCMITVINPDDRREVEAAIQSAGGEILPLEVQSHGLTVTCE